MSKLTKICNASSLIIPSRYNIFYNEFIQNNCKRHSTGIMQFNYLEPYKLRIMLLHINLCTPMWKVCPNASLSDKPKHTKKIIIFRFWSTLSQVSPRYDLNQQRSHDTSILLSTTWCTISASVHGHLYKIRTRLCSKLSILYKLMSQF